jgi:hypothetical protein
MGPVQIWPRLYFAARFPTEATPSASRGPGPGEPLVNYGEVDRSIKWDPFSEEHPRLIFPPPGMEVLRAKNATTRARSHHGRIGAQAQPTGPFNEVLTAWSRPGTPTTQTLP